MRRQRAPQTTARTWLTGTSLTAALTTVLLTWPSPAPPRAAATPPATPGSAEGSGRLCTPTDRSLDEISGLGVLGPDRLVVHEDSGNAARYVVLGADCAVLARRTVPGARNVDWEDLAVADGYLWLADIGDNRATRAGVVLYRVGLPSPPGGAPGAVTTYRLRYTDGPHDAEALLVLPGRVAVVTKVYAGPARVYEADLAGGLLSPVAELSLPRTGGRGGPAGSLTAGAVTGGAVSPDGRLVALRTYASVYVWRWGGALAATFAGEPAAAALPDEPQGEAVSFTADGQALLVASEGVGEPVLRVPVPTATVAAGVATRSAAAAPAGSSVAPSVARTEPAGGSSGPRLGVAARALVAGLALLLALVAVITLIALIALASRRRRRARP